MGNPWFFSVHLSFGTSVQKLHHRPFTNFTIFQGRAVAHGINCSPPFPCYLYIQWDKQTNPHGFSSVPKNLPRLDRPKKDPNRFDFDACHGLQLIMIPMIFRFFKKYGKMWRKIWHQSRILGIWKTCDVFFSHFRVLMAELATFQPWSLHMSCSNRFESSYPTMRSAGSRTRRWHCSRAFHWIFWCIWMDGWNQVWVTIDFLSIKLDFEPFGGTFMGFSHLFFQHLSDSIPRNKWLKCLGDQHGANKNQQGIIANGAVVCTLLSISPFRRTAPFWKITSIPSTTPGCD